VDPLIISCAVTGALATKDDNPHLPFDPEEIGRSCVEAWREGAAIVHIHARHDDGTPAWEEEVFQRTVDVIRSADCDVLINLTTSFGGTVHGTPWEQRFAPIAVGPDLVSFDCGTMNFGPWVFYNPPDFLEELARRTQAAGVKPELEIFDAGHVVTAVRLADAGLLDTPLFFQFVLGVQGGAPPTAQALLHLVQQIPAGSPWSVCAVGREQLRVNAMAIAMGGHARTGLEDNLWFGRDDPASNARLVARVRGLAETLDRPVASPQQARELLGLPAAG
jgi:3-keto-5-aminohexanoate cleavage enzyme